MQNGDVFLRECVMEGGLTSRGSRGVLIDGRLYLHAGHVASIPIASTLVLLALHKCGQINKFVIIVCGRCSCMALIFYAGSPVFDSGESAH